MAHDLELAERPVALPAGSGDGSGDGITPLVMASGASVLVGFRQGAVTHAIEVSAEDALSFAEGLREAALVAMMAGGIGNA